jgi:hypothetical protein
LGEGRIGAIHWSESSVSEKKDELVLNFARSTSSKQGAGKCALYMMTNEFVDAVKRGRGVSCVRS